MRLYKTQYELYAFSLRLKDAQQLKRETILIAEANACYNLKLAINEIIHLPQVQKNVKTFRGHEDMPKRVLSDTMPKR